MKSDAPGRTISITPAKPTAIAASRFQPTGSRRNSAAASVSVSGSADSNVRVWDPQTARCEHVLRGHSNSVMSLQFDGGHRLVTASYDKSLKVWDLRMARELRTLYGHGSAVFCLQFDDAKIFSGSADRSIKLWNFAPI